MTPPRHPSQPLPAEADKPRCVVDYGGMQIWDRREQIRVVLVQPAPLGITGCLRREGFTRRGEGIWDAPHNPMSITTAQAIGSAFFEKDNG